MKICQKCVLDSSDPDLSLDVYGVCQYCRDWAKNSKNLGKIENGKEIWESQVLPEIRKSGMHSKYDAILGASGGVDSSYLAYMLKQYNLNILITHVDGGFNSEIGKRNFKRVIDHTGFKFKIASVSAEAYRQVQLAYFYADVIDTDVPADYLIDASLRIEALKNNVKFVLTGGNYFIDAYMPKAWTKTNKLDYGNLKGIVCSYCKKNLKGRQDQKAACPLGQFPKFGSWDEIKARRFHGLRYVTPLNFLGYNRDEAMKLLQKEWSYEDYGGKHYENILTRFYQRYILPVKFGVDKRKANFSNVIRSGGMTRMEALAKLKEPLYETSEFNSDLKAVLGFLRISEEEFYRVMSRSPREHSDFGSDEWVYNAEKLYAKPRHAVGVVLRKLKAIK